MSATTERQESRGQSSGFVGETLRRPIQEAVKEGVKEALREEADVQGRSGGESGGGGSDDSGGGGGRFALLAILGIGVAAFLLWRRRSGGSGEGGITESIREGSKTIETGESDQSSAGSGGSSGTDEDQMGGAVETTEQSVEAEDAAPGASSE